MIYSEIKNIAEAKKITIKDLAEQMGMTSNGLKRSIENETMGIKDVRLLCSILELSIAEFFDEEIMISNSGNIISRSTAGGDITAGGSACEVMFLRQQIKEKDRQINDLLTILKK